MARGCSAWIVPPFLAALLLLFLDRELVAGAFLSLTLFMVYFHRDPDRVPGGEGMISPADGRIIQDQGSKVSIFMSPFDVHVNRAPLDGVVSGLEYRWGGHRPAFMNPARQNEQNIIYMETPGGPIQLHQIAGIMARKIVCYVKSGDRLSRGDRVGMIRFGSRVEVIIPGGYSILVKNGDRVRAGETVIAVKG
ncbi:MAG: phosphatidylserine decarboxylase [Methanosarcinales archaeon]|nr:phosphatidylserine decarboxylase [Methanosarcinales archaeon]